MGLRHGNTSTGQRRTKHGTDSTSDQGQSGEQVITEKLSASFICIDWSRLLHPARTAGFVNAAEQRDVISTGSKGPYWLRT
jgi:hypothetical protein